MRLGYRVVAGILCCLTLALGVGVRADPADDMAFIRAGDDWFYIDRTEVTVAMFQAFDPDYKPSYEYFEESNMPATSISFVQALAYCKARGKRLPTSKEWPMICPGPEGKPYSYGDGYDPTKARVGRRIWTDGPKAVGSYDPNGFGLYDMVGNAWEWVDDGETEGEFRSVYGGSWVDGPRLTKCSAHRKADPEQRVINYGVRCARSVTEAERAEILGAEAARARAVEEAARRKAAAKKAVKDAQEAARRAKVDTEAQGVLDTKAEAQRVVEAEAARRAEAFARKIADMAPVALSAFQTLYIDRTEVTVEAFQAFDPSYRPDELSAEKRMPATGVTYEQAAAYCRGLGKRLPTADEWLAVCLGEKEYRFSYGADYDPSRIRTGMPWFAGADRAGAGAPNMYDATDMVGNVWEWVDGWYDQAGTLRVLYGGSWVDGPKRARCTGEMRAPPETRRANFGFRCAVDEE